MASKIGTAEPHVRWCERSVNTKKEINTYD